MTRVFLGLLDFSARRVSKAFKARLDRPDLRAFRDPLDSPVLRALLDSLARPALPADWATRAPLAGTARTGSMATPVRRDRPVRGASLARTACLEFRD